MSTVRMSVIVNGFSETGICPFNPQAVPNIKLAPSLLYRKVTPLPKVCHLRKKCSIKWKV